MIDNPNFMCVFICGTAIALGLIWLMGRMIHSFSITSGSLLQSRDHQRRDGLEAMEKLIEKILGDPDLVARFHTNERRYRQAQDAATERTRLMVNGGHGQDEAITSNHPEDASHE